MEIGSLFYTVEVQGIEKVGHQLKNLGSSIADIGSSLMSGISTPILEFFGHGIELASDINEAMNVVNTVFGKSGKEVTKWADNLLESFGLTEKQALNYVGAMGAMLESSGLSTEASKDMSKSLVELTGDMASFYNLKHDEVWEKLRAGIMGETEPLKSLGINMSVANMEAFALSRGINKSWNEMSQAEQVALRYDYIMEKTANAQGDFAKTSDSFANKLRTLRGRLDTLAESIGNLLLPAFESIVNTLDNLLRYAMENIPYLDKIILAFGLLAAAIGPVILAIGGLTIGAGLLITSITTIAGLIASVVSGLGLLLIPIGLVSAGFVAFGAILATIGIGELINKFGSLKGIMEAIQMFIQETLVPAFQYLASGEGLEKVQHVSDGTRNKLESVRNVMVAIKDFITGSLVPALVYLATGQGLEKVQGASDNTKKVLETLRQKLVAIRDYITGTLVPALVYLATGNGLDKVADHGTDLKKNLEELRQTFIDIKNYIMNTLAPALVYLATGKGLNKVEGASDDTKESLKKTRKALENLWKQVEDFDSSGMVSDLNELVSGINDVISAAKKAYNWIKKLMNLNPGVQIGKAAGKAAEAIKGNAMGVRNTSKGEWSLVGERGMELMYIPKGASIYNNSETRGMLNTSRPSTTARTPISTSSSEQMVFNGDIIIDAKSVEDFNNVVDFFKNVNKEVKLRYST